MATLVISSEPAEITSVFQPIQISYEWQNSTCTVFNSSGNLGIRVDLDFSGSVAIGDFVQILNGSYQGSYKVTLTYTDSNYLYIITDGAFVSLDPLSNKFNLDTRQVFELYGGYLSGSGSSIKPYQKIADISVAINPTSNKFEVDLQSYLRSYFSIVDPEVGKDYDLSLQWQIKPVSGTLTDFKFTFYSAETINAGIVGTETPLGNVPLSFLDENDLTNIPTLLSTIESSEKVVENVITSDKNITTTNTSISVNLVSGQTSTLNVVKSSGTWGTMTLDPSVSWATITATVGNTVTIEINSNTSALGDYASVDYNANDYLTTGINSLVGCYALDLVEDGSSVEATINVCIYPALQIRRICPSNSLNFAFLNRSGGWNSMALECKYLKGVDIGGQQTFLDSGNVLRRTEMKGVYASYRLTADLLTTFELDLLSRLRTSIQAYLYNDETEAFDIPIIVDPSSFETYGNRQRQPDRSASFSFRVATKEVVQTQ